MASTYKPHKMVFDQEARAVVERIGTNALPSLIAWLPYPLEGWRYRLRDRYYQLPPRFRRAGIIEWLNYHQERKLVYASLCGFELLKEKAAPAIPQLEKYAARWPRPGAKPAVDALFLIGPPSLSAVTNLLLTTREPGLQTNLLYHLGSVGFQANDAVPAILACLNSQDEAVAAQAAEALGVIGEPPEAIIPGLIAALDRFSVLIQQRALVSLSQFGPAAWAALPKLEVLSLQPGELDASLRLAFQRIAPDKNYATNRYQPVMMP